MFYRNEMETLKWKKIKRSIVSLNLSNLQFLKNEQKLEFKARILGLDTFFIYQFKHFITHFSLWGLKAAYN